MLEKSSELKKLDLTDTTPSITDADFIKIAEFSPSKSLKKIKIFIIIELEILILENSVDVSDESIRNIQNLGGLVHLNLRKCKQITDKLFEEISMDRIQNLTHLALGHTGLTDSGVLKLSELGKYM